MSGDSEARASELDRKRRQANLAPSRGYTRRRSAMMKAAAEVFRVKGLSSTTLDDIGGSIGYDRASVYYYFGSKEQLFRAVILESVEEVVHRAKSIASGTGTVRARLTALIHYIVEAFAANYPALHIFVQEDMRRLTGDNPTADARRLSELADEYMLTMESLIEEGIDAGELRSIGSPRHIALAIQGAINWMHRWFTPDGDISADDLGELFVEMLLGGLATSRRR
jgi:TetR/AcrR family transcriptional regulator, cholesterol catabolism regulator